MAKINSLRDIIQFNSNFKTAINLYLSLNKAEKVLGYIPTKSSVSFLGEYLKAVLENKEQATLLVGPYGKGKSHLLLVLLAVLSMKKTPESESAINELIDNVSKTDEVGERVSEYIGQVWDKKRFLPVLITDTTGDLNQAFLYGLNDALKRDGLLDLAPETYYSIALDRIDDWEQNYFETYKMFERELTQNGMSIAELKTDLKQYSQKTLILFKEIYPKVTAGSEFNPMALADALPLYKSVSEKLVDEYGYSGIYIVFDEFSKFIEGQNNIAAGTNMHLLQSMCELATDSKNAQVFITMVAHKSIKEYVVVLDFIGNYRNNFMIPIALSGDRSYNKDNIRRYVTEGGRVIPGASTIHFDEISRKRIFQAIDNANFSDIKLIRENYTNLKNKLGHIPALADFDKYGEMDVLRIFDNNSLGSYYKFLVKYEKEYTIRLSEDEEKAIEFISKKLASGKRIHELELLKRTLQYHHGIIGRLRKHLSEKYQCEMDEHCTENVVNMMTNEFSMSAAKKTYAQCVFLKKEQDDYGISDVYGKMLQNPEFCAILEELVDFGISRYKVNYSYHYQDTNLVLYQKYTYEDACRLLNWERNEVPLNIGGYKYDKKTKTFPIFINYDKQDNISDTTKYEDHFVAENRLIAISKSGRSMDSEDVQNFLKATERGIDVQLFVRKNKDDKISKEFYYLGRVIATGNAKQFVIPNTDKTAVEIEWELETPVREDIYQYIVNE